MPVPAYGQVLVKIIACGVCRTDIHIMDGELPHPQWPLIPGHEIVGTIIAIGQGVLRLKEGDRIGIPWLAHTCGTCRYCRSDRENLCEHAVFTGYTINGGYATHTVAWEQYCYRLPDIYANASGAPLLCAGLIGYRSYKMMGKSPERIGFYGFGAAAHLLIQVAVSEGKKVYVFTSPGDIETQRFAMELGAVWADDSLQAPPEQLDAGIIFAPHGPLVPKALADLDKGGTVVCAGIHMSNIPSFKYDLLWEERILRSVANLTRADGDDYLKLAPNIPVKTSTQSFKLHEANEAINALRNGKIHGAAVLVMEE
jgi:propanol-preferring alcohol dehydrogenase